MLFNVIFELRQVRMDVGLDKLSLGLLGRDVLPEPAQRALAIVCRGAWARITFDKFRHWALQTF
jgi:hypothetical protein